VTEDGQFSAAYPPGKKTQDPSSKTEGGHPAFGGRAIGILTQNYLKVLASSLVSKVDFKIMALSVGSLLVEL